MCTLHLTSTTIDPQYTEDSHHPAEQLAFADRLTTVWAAAQCLCSIGIMLLRQSEPRILQLSCQGWHAPIQVRTRSRSKRSSATWLIVVCEDLQLQRQNLGAGQVGGSIC